MSINEKQIITMSRIAFVSNMLEHAEGNDAIIRDELRELNDIDEIQVALHKGANFAFVVQKTPVEMRKTNNPWVDRIFKKVGMNVVLVFDYAKMVNKRREQQGLATDFIAGSMSGRHHIAKTPLCVADKDPNKYYLYLSPTWSSTPVYLWDTGDALTESELMVANAFMKEKADAAKYQGLAEGTGVIVRTPLISNVQEIHIQGKVIMLVD